MNVLQEIFHDASLKRLTTRLVTRKFEDKGYLLTEKLLAAVEEQIANSSEDSFTIRLPDEETDIHVSIEDEDIRSVLDEYDENFLDEVQKFIHEASRVILANLRASAPEMLAEHEKFRTSIEQDLWRRWGTGLELLKMFIVIATEAGADFNQEFRALANREQDFRFDVLTRLHARSCQIANEILTLLRSGYADGAHARWRSMHEVSVIGLFISELGQDVAERYLCHNTVESYRAALQYRRHSNRLGYEPLVETELLKIESSYQNLLCRFGSSYAKNYGWAAQALGKDNPTFSDIEEATGLGHWRPHYKFASHNVHASAKGVLFRLGIYPENQQRLLAGPSDTGFADPAHGMAVSLLQITTSLLTLKPNLDRLSICHILSTLAEEIGTVFLSIQKNQERNATSQTKFPPGWDEERMRKVLAHYEEQTGDEAVAEDEAAFESQDQTVMEIPNELVPAVRELIAKHRT